MLNFRHRMVVFMLLCAFCGSLHPTNAQILLKPTGKNAMPLRAKSLKSEVTIQGHFASTRTEMVFQNETYERVEADFIYTVPPRSVVTSFAYWYGREKVVARVVEKARAARIYEYITTRMRDPALIELVGKDTFRARIFPIMPNADLKIEMHLVQTLGAERGGVAYVFPLRPKHKGTGTLGELDLSVAIKANRNIARVTNNLKVPISADSNGYHLHLKQLNYRPAHDWRITLAERSNPLRVSAYAAPSGGRDGFFAVSLIPKVTLHTPKLQFKGVRVYDVLPARLPTLQANHSYTIVGRYSGSGPVHLALRGRAGGQSWSAQRTVTFGAQRENNNLATKLWAERRITALAGNVRHRAAVIALSQRFTLPSKFTSWLAIPQEERERYHAEKVRADLDVIGIEWMELKARGLGRSRRAQHLAAQFKAQCKKGELIEAEEIQRLEYEWPHKKLDETGRLLTEEMAAGRGRSRYAHDLRRRMEWLARKTGGDSDSTLDNFISQCMSQLATEIIDRTYGTRPNPQRARTLRRQLSNLSRFNPDSPDTYLRQAKDQWAYEQVNYLAQVWAEEKLGSRPNTARLASLRREVERIARLTRDTDAKTALGSAESQAVWSKLNLAARRYLSEKHSLHPNQKRLKALQTGMAPLLKKNSTTLQGALDNVKYEWARDEMNRILPEIAAELDKPQPNAAHTRQLLAQHKTIFQEYFGWNEPNVTTEVESRVQDLTALQSKIDKAQTSGKAKDLKTLRVRREELLDDLVAQQMEFSYGGSGGVGDPLIHVAAPPDAMQVIAVLPDGEIKCLVYNAENRRWEARFDIPTHAAEGEFPITIIVVFKDGTRQTFLMSFNVDSTPPTGQGQVQVAQAPEPTVRLSIQVSPETARVAALLPWGEKVELQPSTVQTHIFLTTVPLPSSWLNRPLAVTYILTDKAHNRTLVTVDLND